MAEVRGLQAKTGEAHCRVRSAAAGEELEVVDQDLRAGWITDEGLRRLFGADLDQLRMGLREGIDGRGANGYDIVRNKAPLSRALECW